MIIGLAGAKTAGKNTVAKIISKEFGFDYQVNEWSFAEDLKISAMNALGGTNYTPEEAIKYADAFKEYGYIEVGIKDHPDFLDDSDIKSGREYLQWYGTEAHRNVFGDDFWVDNLLDKIFEDMNNNPGKRLDVITDVRFPNEAKAIRNCDGVVVRVSRPSVENSGDTHASETPLPDELIDSTIVNNSTLDALQIETMLRIKRIAESYGRTVFN